MADNVSGRNHSDDNLIKISFGNEVELKKSGSSVSPQQNKKISDVASPRISSAGSAMASAKTLYLSLQGHQVSAMRTFAPPSTSKIMTFGDIVFKLKESQVNESGWVHYDLSAQGVNDLQFASENSELSEQSIEDLQSTLKEYFPEKADDFARDIQVMRSNIMSVCDHYIERGLMSPQAIIHIKANDIEGGINPYLGQMSFIYNPALKSFAIRIKKPLGQGSYKQVFPLIMIDQAGRIDSSKVYIKSLSKLKIIRKDDPGYNPSQTYASTNIKRERKLEEEEQFVHDMHTLARDSGMNSEYLLEPTLLKGERGVYTSEGEQKHFYIANRYRGSLSSELKKGDSLSNEKVSALLGQFIDSFRGVSYLHHQGYAHLDLKPANLFVSQEGRGMVGDLGFCAKGGKTFENPPYAYGTPAYTDPTSSNTGEYDQKSDIYSLGVSLEKLQQALVKARGNDSLTDSLKDLSDRMKVPDKGARPDIDQVIEELEQLQAAFHGEHSSEQEA